MSETNCGSEHCITCSDEGTAMTVIGVDRARSLARCRGDQSRMHSLVDIGLVDAVRPGDRILVHAGTAIARLAVEGPVR